MRPEAIINLGREQEARILNERALRNPQGPNNQVVDKLSLPRPGFRSLLSNLRAKVKSSK